MTKTLIAMLCALITCDAAPTGLPTVPQVCTWIEHCASNMAGCQSSYDRACVQGAGAQMCPWLKKCLDSGNELNCRYWELEQSDMCGAWYSSRRHLADSGASLASTTTPIATTFAKARALAGCPKYECSCGDGTCHEGCCRRKLADNGTDDAPTTTPPTTGALALSSRAEHARKLQLDHGGAACNTGHVLVSPHAMETKWCYGIDGNCPDQTMRDPINPNNPGNCGDIFYCHCGGVYHHASNPNCVGCARQCVNDAPTGRGSMACKNQWPVDDTKTCRAGGNNNADAQCIAFCQNYAHSFPNGEVRCS